MGNTNCAECCRNDEEKSYDPQIEANKYTGSKARLEEEGEEAREQRSDADDEVVKEPYYFEKQDNQKPVIRNVDKDVSKESVGTALVNSQDKDSLNKTVPKIRRHNQDEAERISGNQLDNSEVQNTSQLNKLSLNDAPNPIFAVKANPQDCSLNCEVNRIRSKYNEIDLQAPSWYKNLSPFYSQDFYHIPSRNVYYCGEWMQGIPHGMGEVILADGSYFRGYFEKGVANGPRCVFISSTGTTYQGAWMRNERNNTDASKPAIYKDAKYEYKGEWLSNRPHGMGEQLYQNGDVYQGRYVKGEKQGDGRYLWKNTAFQQYKGFFKDSLMYGEGTLVMATGEKIAGKFDCREQFKIERAKFEYQGYNYTATIQNGRMLSGFSVEKDGIEVTNIGMDRRGVPHSGTMTANNETYSLFQGKKLLHVDASSNYAQIRSILNHIQIAYSDETKHSLALQKLKQSLPNFTCEFYNHTQQQKATVIVNICGRTICVCRPQQP